MPELWPRELLILNEIRLMRFYLTLPALRPLLLLKTLKVLGSGW